MATREPPAVTGARVAGVLARMQTKDSERSFHVPMRLDAGKAHTAVT